jgi:hypothetical protein
MSRRREQIEPGGFRRIERSGEFSSADLALFAGMDLQSLGLKLVQTGGIGAFILIAGRMLRRAKGLTAYVWLFGGFLTFVGVLIASGVLDVDIQQILQIARWGGDAVRVVARVVGGRDLTPVG